MARHQRTNRARPYVVEDAASGAIHSSHSTFNKAWDALVGLQERGGKRGRIAFRVMVILILLITHSHHLADGGMGLLTTGWDLMWLVVLAVA